MWNLFKRLVNKFVPDHIADPELAIRMIRSRNPAAWFAILTTFLGILCTPIDLLLQNRENRHYQKASKPKLPVIFVCGAPRTGTTLVSQVLIKNLPVAYFNNLTAIFPRSPIEVNRLFGRFLGKKIDYNSYYSKTNYLSGPNDAFYIWDRWMAEDETGMRCVLIDEKKDEMVQFFGAFQNEENKPIVSKNNSLNTRASVVANSLDNSYFICMTRNPAYVAQSLLQARLEIQGDVRTRLWVDNPDKSEIHNNNYIEDVCDQVLYHEQKITEQQHIIGSDRFWIVSYEEFCKAPNVLIEQIYEQILGQAVDTEQLQSQLKPFNISNRIRVESETFAEIEQTLASRRNHYGDAHQFTNDHTNASNTEQER